MRRYRKAGEVCGDCIALMKDGQAFRDFAAKPKDRELVLITSLPYHYPYIAKGNHNGSDANRKFSDAFTAVVKAVAEDPPKIGYEAREKSKPLVSATGTGDEPWRQDELAMLPKGLPPLLCALYHAAVNLALDAYAQGHEDGEQLLTRLASGEVTVGQFNELAKAQGSVIREQDREVIQMMNDAKLPAKVRKAAERLYHFHRHRR